MRGTIFVWVCSLQEQWSEKNLRLQIVLVFVSRATTSRPSNFLSQRWAFIINLRCISTRWGNTIWMETLLMAWSLCKVLIILLSLPLCSLKPFHYRDPFYVSVWPVLLVRTRHDTVKNLPIIFWSKWAFLNINNSYVHSPVILRFNKQYRLLE